MRTAATAVLVLLGTLAWAGDGGEQTGPVILLGGGQEPCRLRLDVLIDGGSPTVAWGVFLDHLFDYFDRDGNGFLNAAEVGRMFSLTLPGRKQLAIDFAKLDADGNGKASLAELKAFCRDHGFTPIVAVVEPPSVDDLRLGDLLLRRLDADGDGKLTGAEWDAAVKRLRKFDLNEDEFLVAEELLASAPAAPTPGEPRANVSAGKETAVLRVDIGKKAPSASAQGIDLTSVGGLHRLIAPDSGWSASVRPSMAMTDASLAGDFLAAQLKTALGDKPALSKAALEQDLTLGGLGELFPFADRNGDERLSLPELEDYLKLIDKGVRSQVWVKVAERGRNPFFLLDTDGDGRLSERELAKASGSVKGPGWPWQFQIMFGGPVAASWGHVPIPVPRRSQAVPTTKVPLPRWLGAMDRNDDGVVSLREFVGSPELFRELDTDGDAVIGPEEARRAERRYMRR